MALESVGGSIISKIAELMVEPVGRQFRYMFCFNNFVEEFKEQKENLALALDGLQKEVEAAERNAEEIKKGVKKWMEDANSKIEGAKPLENEIGKNGKCFTWCPNCMRQFKLSKALAKKSETFRKLLENSTKFTKASDIAHPQPIEFLPSKEFTPSKSSEEAFEQIMEAIKDDKVNMIGLCGMGGVGKTTLVKRVGTIARELQLFDEVLMATVSQNPNVIDIQNRMADKLGLVFEERSKEGRADRLWQRLKKVEKMLIILDDVWNHIDLKEIGIPFGDDRRGCKILLTTRRTSVCSAMECQQKVFLRELPEKEAWDLFRINAGLHDGSSTLNKVAREVARECHGLPIALVTVGRALREESAVKWKRVSKQLKNSQFPDMEQIEEKNAYACLKLSYDYLKSKETKLCFLLCCLFPEDYNIPIEDLTRCAVGYGLHQDGEPIEDAREQVHVAIKDLKACCLLLGSETEEHVRMHDLVRDVAIQIASSKEYGFMVLEKWPTSIESLEGCTAISLMGNKLSELPEGLVCPQLKVLLLEVDYGMNVPQRFFEGMIEIEVLSLVGGCLSLQSLELSTKLQSLLLMECECKDLISLRKLQRLKILGLMWCLSIEELPDEIGELKELRLLDVTSCLRLRRIPVNLIGRLKKLEELLIGDCSFDGWDVVGCDSTGGMNASLTELNSLSNLAVLSLRIPEVEIIPRDFVFPRLLKYDISLGNYNPFIIGYPTSTRLHLDNTSATSLNAKILEQLFPTVSQIVFWRVEVLKNTVLFSDHEQQNGFFQRLEFVEVWHCGDIGTLFPAKVLQVLKNLRSVKINGCKSLEEVFELDDESNVEELPLLSSLTRLELEMLPELKCIWKGPTRHVSLQSLIHLNLNRLHKLTFIFTPSLAQSLPRLETLEIRNCRELKHVVREEEDEWEIISESLGFPELKTLHIFDCAELEYVFPRSKVLQFLKNLRSVKINGCKSLEEVFELDDESNVEELPLLSSLTRLELEMLPELKCIWKGPTRHVSLQSLIHLNLNRLHKLTFIFTPSLAQSLPRLETLEIRNCRELKHVVREEEDEWEIISESLGFPELKTLHIFDCAELEYVFPRSKVLQFLKNLRSVKINGCKSLEEVFELDDESNVEELPLLSSLTRLELEMLPELKCIWKGPTRHVSLQSLIHLNLNRLHKLTFIFTPSLAQSLSRLETLEIRNCRELKYVLREEDDEREIIPELLGFPELKTLYIFDCAELEYVFPISVSPSLQNLEEMKIDNADNLKQIFYGEGDALTRDGIIKFPQLRELILWSESNYSFFGPKNFAAQLPSLQNLTIHGHEELGNLLVQLQVRHLNLTIHLYFLC